MVSIYNKKTRFLVLDIETPREPNSIIIDIAFAVWSRAEGKFGSAGYLVEESENYQSFYKKEGIYQEYKDSGLYHVRPFAKIMDIMDRIIDRYSPSFGVAYNSAFDFTKIRDECERQGIFCPLDRLREFDLMRASCETIGQQKTFKKFVDTNKLLTKKGNRLSTAQVMYQYIKVNPSFVEEHTGLGDIEIEIKILEKVLRQKKKMSMIVGGDAWRLVQG